MKTLQLLSLLFFAAAFASCSGEGGLICTKPSGDTVTEERELNSFNRIDLSMDAEVYLIQGDESSVRIEASDNITDLLVTDIDGDELNLRTKRGKCIRGSSNVKFFVTCSDIEGITLSGSGKIMNETPLKGSDLDVRVSGSGKIDLEDLDYTDAQLSISGSGQITIDGFAINGLEAKTSGSGKTNFNRLEALNVTMDVTGSGSMRFENSTTNRLDASITGSGRLYAFDMPADRVEINVGGSGDCEVLANDELDVRITGSGSVFYKGSPSINQNITGSGKIKNAN